MCLDSIALCYTKWWELLLRYCQITNIHGGIHICPHSEDEKGSETPKRMLTCRGISPWDSSRLNARSYNGDCNFWSGGLCLSCPIRWELGCFQISTLHSLVDLNFSLPVSFHKYTPIFSLFPCLNSNLSSDSYLHTFTYITTFLFKHV